jgi:hypothetical protein
MGKSQKVAVESSQPTDLHAACLVSAELQAELVATGQVMMPYIGRIANQQIKPA